METATQPIFIFMGITSEGVTYELDTASQERLRQVPGARPVRKVFFAYDREAVYEKRHELFDHQVVRLLTGLSVERLKELGGVELYDPRSQTTTPLSLESAA